MDFVKKIRIANLELSYYSNGCVTFSETLTKMYSNNFKAKKKIYLKFSIQIVLNKERLIYLSYFKYCTSTCILLYYLI